MAPVAINVAPGLRPWRQAGVTHLLLDATVASALRAAATVAPGNRVERARPPAPPMPPGAPEATTPPPGLAAPRHNSRPNAAGTPPASGVSAAPVAAPAPAAVPAPAAASARPVSTPPAAAPWPAAWESLWQQMSASGGRAAAVWTYAELGTDLRGQASQARREALQALIRDLKLPRGSHAFWPYALPPGNTPEPDMFLAGLARFQPGLVLMAGGRAAADLVALGPLPEVDLQLGVCRGSRCIRLPELETIASFGAARRAQLLALIRAALS